MRNVWMTLILFGLFLLEGTLLPWLLPGVWQNQVQVSPHFVFVVILYVALYANRYLALALGLGFGLLQDFIFYGPMIGAYSFSMGLTSYLAGLAFRRAQVRLISSLLFIGVGNFLFECIHFGLYRLFDLASVSFRFALLHQMLPSILINLLFALLIYLPIRKLLEKLDAEPDNQED